MSWKEGGRNGVDVLIYYDVLYVVTGSGERRTNEERCKERETLPSHRRTGNKKLAIY